MLKKHSLFIHQVSIDPDNYANTKQINPQSGKNEITDLSGINH
jgi:hypothetical protein